MGFEGNTKRKEKALNFQALLLFALGRLILLPVKRWTTKTETTFEGK